MKQKASKSISTVIISAIQKLAGLSESDHCELSKLYFLVGKNDNKLPIKTEVVVDTSAQVAVAGEFHMKHLGIKEKQLSKSHQPLQHAGREALKVLGSYSIYVVQNEKLIETEVYFVKGVTNMLLSLDMCKRLCLVYENFSHINVNETSLNTITDEIN